MPTLAQARRRKLLTQRQLADKMGIKHTLVSAWERGIYEPRLSNLKKLCEILEITFEQIEFLPRPEKPKASPKTSAKTANELSRQQIEAHDESMGYVDSTWLRGGRYDIDPAHHEISST